MASCTLDLETGHFQSSPKREEKNGFPTVLARWPTLTLPRAAEQAGRQAQALPDARQPENAEQRHERGGGHWGRTPPPPPGLDRHAP